MTAGTITRSAFIRELVRDSGSLDINNLSTPVQNALTEAGVSQDELKSIAGKDGKIRSSREFDKLFGVVDRFDSNGSGNSFATQQTSEGGDVQPTVSGELYEALQSEVSANRALANGNLSAKGFTKKLSSSHGVIDTSHMSDDLKAAFSKSGISQDQLKSIAGADGQIKGAEFSALHDLVDGADGSKDGVVTTKEKLEDGTVRDVGANELSAAISSEVANNRKLERYQKPGVKSAGTQARKTAATNALVVPEKDRQPDVDLNMKGISQFSLYPDDRKKGEKACFQAAVKQADDYNRTNKPKDRPRLTGPEQAIQVAYAEDGNGRVKVDSTQAKLGRAYIDKNLDEGRPVVVGVSYDDNAYNYDRMTDHFVTIDKRGHDENGRLFYEFKDPGAGGRRGRFYVDKDTGSLFKQGAPIGQQHYVEDADYELTQVRTYQGVE